jgi:hypothetical protein
VSILYLCVVKLRAEKTCYSAGGGGGGASDLPLVGVRRVVSCHDTTKLFGAGHNERTALIEIFTVSDHIDPAAVKLANP